MTQPIEAPGQQLLAPAVELAAAPTAPSSGWSVAATPREAAQWSRGGPTLFTPALASPGFWSAVLVAGASLTFSVASVPVLLGVVPPPWDNLLTLGPSLVLASAFLALLVCVQEIAPARKEVWGHLAVAFGGVYVALVSVVYTLTLTVVEPLIMRGDAA
jgi:drug/metabolite transporter superfamily protein YnfA